MIQRILFSCIVLLVAIPSSQVAGDLIYDVQSYTGFDDAGWSLDGGTITTDGTLGELAAGNIVGWSIDFTSPANSINLTQANSTLNFIPALSGLIASLDTLLMTPNPTTSGHEQWGFTHTSGTSGVNYLSGDIDTSPGIGLTDTTAFPNFTARTFGLNQSYVVASRNVPEPGGLLVFAGLAGLAAFRRFRR